MTFKQDLVCNGGSDAVEEIEDFGDIRRTKFIALHAIAFMVRDLCSKWKQPISYSLSSGPVKSTILQTLTVTCIDKLNKTGLKVVASVCYYGFNNRGFQHLENVTTSQPYVTVIKFIN